MNTPNPPSRYATASQHLRLGPRKTKKTWVEMAVNFLNPIRSLTGEPWVVGLSSYPLDHEFLVRPRSSCYDDLSDIVYYKLKLHTFQCIPNEGSVIFNRSILNSFWKDYKSENLSRVETIYNSPKDLLSTPCTLFS